MKKKLGYIISGIIVCFIASLILNRLALNIIEAHDASKLFYLLLPIVLLGIGVSILAKGIRFRVNS